MLEILFRTMQDGYRGFDTMSNQSFQKVTCLEKQRNGFICNKCQQWPDYFFKASYKELQL